MRKFTNIGTSIVSVIVLSLSAMSAAANTWIDIDEDEGYTARHETSFVQAGDRFYLFGGRESPEVVDTYDFEQDSWTTSASAPLPFNHFQATEYQGLIWVIGAFKDNGFPREEPADFIYTFDPANNLWIQGREIPIERRRGSGGLVEYNDKFYVVGGNTIGHNGGFVSWFDEFDPKTGTWTELEDAPNARDHFHATVADDKLYVAGGRLSGGPGGVFSPLIAAVDVYDFATSTWSTLPASGNLPTPRAGTSTVTFQGNVVVIGGEGNGQAFNTVEQLNPLTNFWTEIAPMNFARHGTQAIVSGDGIFITAGSFRQGGSRQHNLEAFNSSVAVGQANTAGQLSFVLEEAVITSNEPLALELTHSDGTQGALITGITFEGGSASNFMLTDQNVLPNLVAVGSNIVIPIRANTDIDGEFSNLVVTYDNGATAIIPVRTQFETLVETNLIQNGSFEDITINNGRFLISSEPTGWQKNGNGDTEYWQSGFLGQPAQDGNVLIELDVGGQTVDSLSQDITTINGQIYELSLYLKARPNTVEATNQLTVLWNDIEIATYTGGSDWQQQTISVIGTGFDRLTLAETSDSNDGLGTHIDNVSLVDVTPAVPISNLSLGGIAQQISTRVNGQASRAIDGNTSGLFFEGSVTHTTDIEQPWWEVDLGSQSIIESVNIFNRTDNCCRSRLSNFYVLISDEPFANRSLDELLNDPSIERSFHTGLSGDSLEVDVNNISGRYVRIQRQEFGVLSLAEVEVMGFSQ